MLTALRQPGSFALSLLTALAAAVLVSPCPCLAQTAPSGPADSAWPPISKIEADLGELEGQTSLPEDARSLAEQARHQMAIAGNARTSLKSFQAMTAQAAARQDALQRQLREVATQPDVSQGASTTEALEQQLHEARQQLESVQQRKQKLEAGRAFRQERLEAIPKELAALNERLTSLEVTPETAPATTTQPALARAQRLAREAEAASLAAQISLRRAEAAAYESTASLLPLETQLAAKQVLGEQYRVSVLTKRLDESRHRDYEAALRQMPAVAPLLADTLALQEAAREIKSNAASAAGERDRLERQAERLGLILDDVRQRFELAGQTEEIGRLLRQQRGLLPDDVTLEDRLRIARRRAREAKLQELDYQARQSDLPPEDEAVSRVLASVPKDRRTSETSAYVRAEVEKRAAALRQTIQAQQEYVPVLDGVVQQRTRVIETVAKVREFIDENLLWIRNAPAMGRQTPRALARAMTWLGSPTQWSQAGKDLGSAAAAQPFISGAMAVLAIGLLVGRGRIRRKLDNVSRMTEEDPPGSLSLLAQALGLTVVLGILWPALLWMFASRLASAPAASPFTRSLAQGLGVTALALLPIQLLRATCRANGLGRLQLRWDEPRVVAARRTLLWLLPPAPLLGLAEMASLQQAETDLDAVQQLALVVSLLFYSGVTAMMLRPNGPLVMDRDQPDARGLTRRMRWAWYGVLVIGLPMMAVAAALGYLYAVRQILDMAWATVWLVLGAMTVRDVTMRTIFHVRRVLVRRQVHRARQQQEQEGQDSAGESVRDQVSQVSAASDEVSRLVRMILLVAGLAMGWLIWDDLLPTIRGLARVKLWSGAEGPVSLLSILGAIAAAALTVYATRTAPRMIDVVLLVRLRLDAGARYAISTLTRYCLLIVGVVVVAHYVGITWASVQFVVAALGLGLGFGLQEIFANFISGIIILLERPIRVGDLVTIGQVSGRVSRIQIRATTITDWDRKELIIPNKEFITGQMVNWSLSDRTLRLVIPVGVAYGSDTELTRQTLLEVAQANPKILADPPPQALFLGFGDSALNFELRAFVADIDELFTTRHALHMAVDAAFREKRITVAFPQCDVHMFHEDKPSRLPEAPPSGP
jgi:potassium-dependent mechanosensitive channel